MFSALGVYAVTKNPVNIPLMLLFGMVGYIMNQYGYSIISFVLGFVLIPVAELEFYKAWQMSGGNVSFFISPLSILLFLVTIVSILYEIRKQISY